MLSVKPGNNTAESTASLALLMMVNWFWENCVPSPLKTRVRARLGVTTIIPGMVPTEIGGGAGSGRTSVCAFTRYTPAGPLADPTLLVRKARYVRPLVCVPLEDEPPQLGNIKLAGSRKNRRIRALFKPGLQPHAG